MEEYDEPLSKKKSAAAAANRANNYDDEREEEEEEEEEENVLLEEDESFSEIEEEDGNSGSSCRMLPPVNDREAILYLCSTWGEINLPLQEKDLQGKNFAAIYYADGNRKIKPKLFVAKFLNRILADEDGATSSVNLDCPFELAIGSPTVLFKQPPHLEKDTGNFEAYNVISGPLKVTFIGRKKWDIPAYPNVAKTFKIVSKIDREVIYRQLYDLSAIPKRPRDIKTLYLNL